ncbi:hypothetical protein IWW35_004624, partial [Coemansia sp. RSA 1878]
MPSDGQTQSSGRARDEKAETRKKARLALPTTEKEGPQKSHSVEGGTKNPSIALSMPTSASPVVAAVTRLNATQPLRPFVAYAQPSRLSFIQARRAASSAALYSRAAGPSPAHSPRAVSGVHGKAAVSLAARGLSASALTRAAAAPRGAPAAAAKDSVAPAVADATSSVGSGERLLQPDASLALDQQSVGKLLTVWMVYQACGSTKLVQMAPKILKLFEKLRLSWLSNAVVRRT